MDHLAEVPLRWKDYEVTICFDVIGGRIEVTEYRILALLGQPLGWPRPPLAALAAKALGEMRTRWAPQIVHQSRSPVAVAAAKALLGTPGPRRGRPPLYGAEHWAEVARVYEGAHAAPVRTVARTFSVSDSLARKWVERARADGLLPATTPGRRS